MSSLEGGGAIGDGTWGPPPSSASASAGLLSSGGGSYDWTLDENRSKWRGVLTDGLAKLLRNQSNDALADQEVLDHVEGLLLNLLALLTKKPAPLTLSQVEVGSPSCPHVLTSQ